MKGAKDDPSYREARVEVASHSGMEECSPVDNLRTPISVVMGAVEEWEAWVKEYEESIVTNLTQGVDVHVREHILPGDHESDRQRVSSQRLQTHTQVGAYIMDQILTRRDAQLGDEKQPKVDFLQWICMFFRSLKYIPRPLSLNLLIASLHVTMSIPMPVPSSMLCAIEASQHNANHCRQLGHEIHVERRMKIARRVERRGERTVFAVSILAQVCSKLCCGCFFAADPYGRPMADRDAAPALTLRLLENVPKP